METDKAIEKVKEFTQDENVLASVQILLSIIPWAGGPLSTILSEYRNRRNAKRLFHTLDELREAIEALPEEKQHILSPDEVVEIVHNTLEETARTSNEEKLGYLRNSLVRAFTAEEISYSQKQHYLSVLRGLTLGELELIREIYISGDPFDQSHRERQPLIGIDGVWHTEQTNVIRLPQRVRYIEPNTGETLRDVLKRRLSHLSEGALEGVVNSLDSKGLSRIEPNLEKRTIKVSEYPDMSQIGIVTQQTNMSFLQLSGDMPTGTPIEASRTKFGEDFVEYIRSKY